MNSMRVMKRNKAIQSFEDYDEYLKSLEMKAEYLYLTKLT